MAITFGILVPLLVVGLIVAGIVALVRRREEAPPLTFATAVHAYTAVVLVVCIILAVVGGALLLKAVFSEAGPRDFSYEIVPEQGGPFGSTQISGEEAARNKARDDIAIGATLLTIGVLLGIVHGFGKVAAARRDQGYARLISRSFDVVLLAVGTIGGLTSIARLLNDLLRRYVITSDTRQPFQIPHPGDPLAFTIGFVPLWIFFGYRVWRLLATSPPASASAAAPPVAGAPSR